MTEKQTPVSRALIAAAKMPAPQARRILMLICESGMTMDVPQPTQGEIHYSKREKFIKRMKSSCDRVFDYAKHETLHNIEKHFNETGMSASEEPTEEEKKKALAERLAFEKKVLAITFLAALQEEQQAAIQTAGQQLFDEVGFEKTWKPPLSDVQVFLRQRANLLANVPDEIHTEIMQSIEQGLQNGESRKELMTRISTAFDEIGRSRAETIANTETAAAFNYARDKAMREAGVTHKKWLHSMSPLIKEPRPTHLEADGQVQPIDEPFDVGGVQFMRPADDSLGAGPEDIINCHCVAIPVEAPLKSSGGPPVGHAFRGNQYTGGISWNRENAQAYANVLGGTVVGSVATKGQSLRNDLDIKVANYNQKSVESELAKHGFEYTGSSLVSPKEAAASRKDFGKGWQRQENFKHADGRTIGVWHIDK